MSSSLTPTAENPFVLHFGAVLRKFDDGDFYEFCQANPDWRIERTSDGDIIIMPILSSNHKSFSVPDDGLR